MVRKIVAVVAAAAVVATLGLFLVVGTVVAGTVVAVGSHLREEPTLTLKVRPPRVGAWPVGPGALAPQTITITPEVRPPRVGAWGRICRGAGVVSEAISQLLGMTPEEVRSERAAGKTLAQIAQAKGVSDQQLIDALLAPQVERIEQAVKDGQITQAQADWLLARARAMAPLQISNPFAPRGGRGRMRGGPCFRSGS